MTLTEIIEQLESCKFECEAGPLEKNVAFIQLKERVKGIDESMSLHIQNVFTHEPTIIVLNWRRWYESALRYLWAGNYDLTEMLEKIELDNSHKDALEILWLGEGQ